MRSELQSRCLPRAGSGAVLSVALGQTCAYQRPEKAQTVSNLRYETEHTLTNDAYTLSCGGRRRRNRWTGSAERIRSG